MTYFDACNLASICTFSAVGVQTFDQPLSELRTPGERLTDFNRELHCFRLRIRVLKY